VAEIFSPGLIERGFGVFVGVFAMPAVFARIAGAGKPPSRRYLQSMPDATLFQAVIVPHRSLSPKALRRLLIVICTLCGSTSAMFVWLGAWPVGGFTGLELLLAAGLFRLNARAVRGSELVLLTEQGLRVVRTDPKGQKRELNLQPAWLHMSLEERPGRVPALMLTARHIRVEIAHSLGEDEKRDLAGALSEALHRWRNPRFDNPQLRED